MWCSCGQSERTTSCRGKIRTLGKGKLRSPVGGAIYANVIWPGMKWKYAARLTCLRPTCSRWYILSFIHDLLRHKAANKIQWNTTKAQV